MQKERDNARHRRIDNHEDEDDDDPVSVRQQLVSELSVRRQRRSTKSKDLNLRNVDTVSYQKSEMEASQPDVEMFD